MKDKSNCFRSTAEPTERRCDTVTKRALAERATIRPKTAALVIVVTLHSAIIRICEDKERHLEVRIDNVETKSRGRQVFCAVAKADTDIKVLIRRSLDAVGRTDNTKLAVYTDGCPGSGTLSAMSASLNRRFSTGFIPE